MFLGKKVTGPAEWLLVCLGNYGKQYENTRHNIGFMAAERLIDKQGLRCNRLRLYYYQYQKNFHCPDFRCQNSKIDPFQPSK